VTIPYGFSLGRHVTPFHDERSRDFPAARGQLVTTEHVHVGPVLDQGNLGSCTGNAMAQCLNTVPFKKPERGLLVEHDAVALYSWATHHDRTKGVFPPEDTGSEGLYVAKAAKQLGLISGYTHAFGMGHFLEALVVSPCIVGTVWTAGMFDVDMAGFVSPSGDVEGGHEYLALGVDFQNKYLTFLNSWGFKWGLNGYFKMKFDDFESLLEQQGDVVVPIL
jgi:hypothetical protein